MPGDLITHTCNRLWNNTLFSLSLFPPVSFVKRELLYLHAYNVCVCVLTGISCVCVCVCACVCVHSVFSFH